MAQPIVVPRAEVLLRFPPDIPGSLAEIGSTLGQTLVNTAKLLPQPFAPGGPAQPLRAPRVSAFLKQVEEWLPGEPPALSALAAKLEPGGKGSSPEDITRDLGVTETTVDEVKLTYE